MNYSLKKRSSILDYKKLVFIRKQTKINDVTMGIYVNILGSLRNNILT